MFAASQKPAKLFNKPARGSECGLTPRSRRGPTASHQARAGGTGYIFTGPGLVSCRWSRLNSNVRRRISTSRRGPHLNSEQPNSRISMLLLPQPFGNFTRACGHMSWRGHRLGSGHATDLRLPSAIRTTARNPVSNAWLSACPCSSPEGSSADPCRIQPSRAPQSAT